jgi:hypothetical protein
MLRSLLTAVAALAPPDAPPIEAADDQIRAGLRVATFNASLHRPAPGRLATDLAGPGDPQARAVAEIVQRVRPELLLLCEFDQDAEAARLFQENYLGVGQNDAAPIEYAHVLVPPSNTGVASGLDLDRDGAADGPGDAYGVGSFPGQYGMLLLARHPILHERVRSFQRFRWCDMPGALLPDDPTTPAPGDWYGPEALEVVRLSSKNHCDVPVEVNGRVIHLLISHPTPPVFDGPEDRNGRRNHDEIRLWADYIDPVRGAYLGDDGGRRGGIEPGARFVILGDLNADPCDGESVPGAAGQLLGHPLIGATHAPAGPGGRAWAAIQGGANAAHRGPPERDTADFRDRPGPGNLRVDYVLPSSNLRVLAAGVFWPGPGDGLARRGGGAALAASDHRLVWMDLDI